MESLDTSQLIRSCPHGQNEVKVGDEDEDDDIEVTSHEFDGSMSRFLGLYAKWSFGDIKSVGCVSLPLLNTSSSTSSTSTSYHQDEEEEGGDEVKILYLPSKTWNLVQFFSYNPLISSSPSPSSTSCQDTFDLVRSICPLILKYTSNLLSSHPSSSSPSSSSSSSLLPKLRIRLDDPSSFFHTHFTHIHPFLPFLLWFIISSSSSLSMLYVCVNVCMCICMCVCLCVCVCMCMYMCVYVYMYVYVCIYVCMCVYSTA